MNYANVMYAEVTFTPDFENEFQVREILKARLEDLAIQFFIQKLWDKRTSNPPYLLSDIKIESSTYPESPYIEHKRIYIYYKSLEEFKAELLKLLQEISAEDGLKMFHSFDSPQQSLDDYTKKVIEKRDPLATKTMKLIRLLYSIFFPNEQPPFC